MPYQSVSLFHGVVNEDRRERVIRLFEAPGDLEKDGRTVWRMAEGRKAQTEKRPLRRKACLYGKRGFG
jgi:hypothetical protein